MEALRLVVTNPALQNSVASVFNPCELGVVPQQS